MYVLTIKSQDGQGFSASTVNWVTQTSSMLPLVAVGVKGCFSSSTDISETGELAVDVIGKEQLDLAFNFFKSHVPEGSSIGGEMFELVSATGCPLIVNTPAWWGYKVLGQGQARGSHAVHWGAFEAGPRNEDNATLTPDHNLNYGG